MSNDRHFLLAPELLLIGRGVANRLPDIVAERGHHCLIVADPGGAHAASAAVAALQARQPGSQFRLFHGECARESIERLARDADSFDVVLAVGGGKVLDTGKGVAAERRCPCVTLPTSAATCAAYTSLCILHTTDGAYVDSVRLPQPVAAAIVDPGLILTAPARYLAAGIADALARAFDTILAARCGLPDAAAATSLAICHSYTSVALLPLGARALDDHRRGETSDSFTRIVEASIVGAGLAGELGGRFFGRSFSHAVGYALSHVVHPDRVLHGEAVALGLLVHCLLDPQPPLPLDRLARCFAQWGLPTSFSALGVRDITAASGWRLAECALDYLDLERAIPFPVDARRLREAMLTLGASPQHEAPSR